MSDFRLILLYILLLIFSQISESKDYYSYFTDEKAEADRDLCKSTGQ